MQTVVYEPITGNEMKLHEHRNEGFALYINRQNGDRVICQCEIMQMYPEKARHHQRRLFNPLDVVAQRCGVQLSAQEIRKRQDEAFMSGQQWRNEREANYEPRG